MFTYNTCTGSVLAATYTNLSIIHSEFIGNQGYTTVFVNAGKIANIDRSKFINNTGTTILQAWYTSVRISHSKFVGNEIQNGIEVVNTNIYYNWFINITRFLVLFLANTNTAIITNSEFVNNSVTLPSILLDGVSIGSQLFYLNEDMITVSLCKFISNRVSGAIVYIQYYTTAKNLTNNVFLDNSAAFEVYVS